MLKIDNLDIVIENKKVVKNLTLQIQKSQIHAIMGPNGSGKSSLAQTVMGHPSYEVENGVITFGGKDIVDLPPHQRSHLGIFLALQQPLAIPGVTVFQLLKEIYSAAGHEQKSMTDLHAMFLTYLQKVGLSEAFLERGCNENFSGGEKKRFEIVQMLVLQPRLIILDEIDSGLDVDALKIIGKAVQDYLQEHKDASCIVITHYRRILDYIQPDFVHVMYDGAIVHTGDHFVSYEIENRGYDVFI